ncbi:MAG: DUF559 domain-containing protein [Candidatus Pacebacteria bacterium]|nr:DUF559 domain-containing protein [Candidatus Paceibacterota bacterium]
MLRLNQQQKDFIIKNYAIKGLKYCAETLRVPSHKVRIFCYDVRLFRDKEIFNKQVKKRLTEFNKKNAKRLSIIRVGKDLDDYYDIIKKYYLEGNLTHKQIADLIDINQHTLQRFMLRNNITKKVWSEQESLILNELYPSCKKEKVLNELKNKNWRQIQKRANYFKIKRDLKFQYENFIKNNIENNPMKNPEFKRKARASLKMFYKKNPKKLVNYTFRRNKKTDIEEVMYNILIGLGFKDKQDFYFNNYFKTKLSYKFPDFIFPNFKKVIECDGAYWHKCKIKERERDKEFQDRGYGVYHFTDNQILKNTEVVKLQVMKLLKV